MATLEALLAERPWLLADGATGTTLFAMGLERRHQARASVDSASARMRATMARSPFERCEERC